MTDIGSAIPADVAEEQLVTTPAPPTVWPDSFPATASSPPSLDHADLPAPPSGRLRRVFRGRSRGSGLGPSSAPRPARRDRGVLYIWGLGASGWANSFYSAAVQAGTKSWKAFFFGSFDASNFITVDKSPAALWVMELSARVFGVNAWSILVPQALEGVATVGLLYLTVRRWFSPGAALLAGAVVALTPVAALMFRFNNPDALLILLLTAAAYATIRAVETGGPDGWCWPGPSSVSASSPRCSRRSSSCRSSRSCTCSPAPVGSGVGYGSWSYGGVAMLVSAGWWVLAVRADPGGGPTLRRRFGRQQPC